MISQGQYVPPVQTYVPPRTTTPTHIPVQPPTGNTGNTGNEGNAGNEVKRKNLTVAIPKEGGETVNIRAVAGGNVIYSKTHKRSEGAVDITVTGKTSTSVQVYIDGTLVADKVVNFD